MCGWAHWFNLLQKNNLLKEEKAKVASHPGDGGQGEQAARWAGPPAGPRGPEEEAGPAAGGPAWLRKTRGADSGAARCDLCLLLGGQTNVGANPHTKIKSVRIKHDGGITLIWPFDVIPRLQFLRSLHEVLQPERE